jgi:hypothetical protein
VRSHIKFLQVQRLQRYATYGHLKQLVLRLIADDVVSSSDDVAASEKISEKIVALRFASKSIQLGLNTTIGCPQHNPFWNPFLLLEDCFFSGTKAHLIVSTLCTYQFLGAGSSGRDTTPRRQNFAMTLSRNKTVHTWAANRPGQRTLNMVGKARENKERYMVCS